MHPTLVLAPGIGITVSGARAIFIRGARHAASCGVGDLFDVSRTFPVPIQTWNEAAGGGLGTPQRSCVVDGSGRPIAPAEPHRAIPGKAPGIGGNRAGEREDHSDGGHERQFKASSFSDVYNRFSAFTASARLCKPAC